MSERVNEPLIKYVHGNSTITYFSNIFNFFFSYEKLSYFNINAFISKLLFFRNKLGKIVIYFETLQETVLKEVQKFEVILNFI